MRRFMFYGLLLLWAGLFTSSASADKQIRLSDFAFVIGAWAGIEQNATNPMADTPTSSATISENWTEPVADAMTGVFTWAEGSKILVYEFIVVRQTDEGLIMRFKHFNGDLIGWEQKDEFLELEAVKSAENEITFHQTNGDLRLEYRLLEGKLLEIIAADKNSHEVQFSFEMIRQ